MKFLIPNSPVPEPPAVVSVAFGVLAHFEAVRTPGDAPPDAETGYGAEPSAPVRRELTTSERRTYEAALGLLTDYLENPRAYDAPAPAPVPEPPRPPVPSPVPRVELPVPPAPAYQYPRRAQPAPPAREEYDPELHGTEPAPAGFRTVVGPDGQPRLVPLPGTAPPPPPAQVSAGPVQPDELPDMGQVAMEPRNANGKPPAMWPPAPPPGFARRPPRQF